MALKYLFGVRYKDGSEFYQTAEDVSTTRPGGSAFTDVRQEDVQIFQLAHVETHDRYLVDLGDGHFEVGGLPFFAQVPPAGAILRLIFFRRHRHIIVVGGDEPQPELHEIEYHFGWQTTVDGVNHQQTIILV